MPCHILPLYRNKPGQRIQGCHLFLSIYVTINSGVNLGKISVPNTCRIFRRSSVYCLFMQLNAAHISIRDSIKRKIYDVRLKNSLMRFFFLFSYVSCTVGSNLFIYTSTIPAPRTTMSTMNYVTQPLSRILGRERNRANINNRAYNATVITVSQQRSSSLR